MGIARGISRWLFGIFPPSSGPTRTTERFNGPALPSRSGTCSSQDSPLRTAVEMARYKHVADPKLRESDEQRRESTYFEASLASDVGSNSHRRPAQMTGVFAQPIGA